MRELLHINKSFGQALVVKDLSLSLKKNLTTCLLGPSGCGKTTLLNIIAGTLKPDSGEIRGFSETLISCVFQEDRLLPWKTVRENILFLLHGIPERLAPENKEKLTDKMLADVELTAFAHYYPRDLSGGMKQRAALARAFCFPADLLLMDEPFRGLDMNLKSRMMELFSRLKALSEKTVLLVTHDINEAALLADIAIIADGPPLEIRAAIPRPPQGTSELQRLLLERLNPPENQKGDYSK